MEQRDKLEQRISEIEGETGIRPVYNHLLIGKYPLWNTPSCAQLSDFMNKRARNRVLGRFPHDLSKAVPTELKQELRIILDIANDLTINPNLGNSYVGSEKDFYVQSDIHSALDLSTIIELGRNWFIGLQGNVRGLPINATQQQYEEKIAKFTPPGISVGENKLVILASNLNSGNDAAAGVAPILLDGKLRDQYHGETSLLANFYYHMVKRRQEQRAGSLNIKMPYPGYERENKGFEKKTVEKLMNDLVEMYGANIKGEMPSKTGSTRCYSS